MEHVLLRFRVRVPSETYGSERKRENPVDILAVYPTYRGLPQCRNPKGDIPSIEALFVKILGCVHEDIQHREQPRGVRCEIQI